jgi:hypothetical protein
LKTLASKKFLPGRWMKTLEPKAKDRKMSRVAGPYLQQNPSHNDLFRPFRHLRPDPQTKELDDEQSWLRIEKSALLLYPGPDSLNDGERSTETDCNLGGCGLEQS